MQLSYYTLGDVKEARVLFLIKESRLRNSSALNTHYVDRISKETNVNRDKILFLGIPFTDKLPNKKVLLTEFTETLINFLGKSKISLVIISDSKYLPVIYKIPNSKGKLINGKSTNLRGKVFRSILPGIDEVDLILVPDYGSLIHNHTAQAQLDLAMDCVVNTLGATTDIVSTEFLIHKITTVEAVKEILALLLDKPLLATDIEAYSLAFYKASIGTIAFSFNETEAYSIDVNHRANRPKGYTEEVMKLLLNFFNEYTGTHIFHGITYDVPTIIYTLFMKDGSDLEGMLHGLDIFKNSHCTLLQVYLNSNNTVQNHLSLKDNVMSYLGDYAVDVTDITTVSSDDLLRYGGQDTIGTFWLHTRQHALLNKENQKELYTKLMRPSLLVYCKMTLMGLPLDTKRLPIAKIDLQKEVFIHSYRIKCSFGVLQATEILRDIALKKLEKKLHDKIYDKREIVEALAQDIETISASPVPKSKEAKALSKYKLHAKNLSKLREIKLKRPEVTFNIGSGAHLRVLIYDVMKCPVLDTTDTGLPSTEGAVLKRLIAIVTPEKKYIISQIGMYVKAQKVVSTFIKALENNQLIRKGLGSLNGLTSINSSINPQGTLSGRPSSSNPNLLNMPSSGRLGKIIKSLFVAPKGWVICAADFGALESRCDAILTQDPAKRKVYTEGYEGHSLNSFHYFRHKFPNNLKETPEMVNSIAINYPNIRQDAKAPYFALIYGGTFYTLVNLGFTEKEARSIEKSHKELYKESIIYNSKVTDLCIKQGFINAAFDLKVRTPRLKLLKKGQIIKGTQAAESRSVNNAKTQSYSLLMNRATLATENLIKESSYSKDIVIMNTIYDSVYYLVKEDPEIISWLNTHLIKEMEWQELDSLQDPDIPMVSTLEIGKRWSTLTTIPNNSTIDVISNILKRD